VQSFAEHAQNGLCLLMALVAVAETEKDRPGGVSHYAVDGGDGGIVECRPFGCDGGPWDMSSS
jgi:hypothetical protein